jgi:hypothetical protein
MAADERQGRDAANLFGWVAATGQQAQQVARQRRMLPIRLTAAERDTCADDLAEQYAVGRLDDAEFGRRMDLLHRAETHGDLQSVFYGLPTPSLYTTASAPRRRGRWRWVVFAGAVWMAVPFVLLSLVLVLFGREIAAAIFGLPALLWVALFWRWASDRGRSGKERR